MTSTLQSAEERRVRLKIVGPAVEDGRVPLMLLADKLRFLQKSLYNIGLALRKGGKRGKWENAVQRSCQLQFVEAIQGSLEVVTELPPSEALPLKEFDLGLNAINTFGRVLQAVHVKQHSEIVDLFPDIGARARTAKSIIPILPEEGEDYQVQMRLGKNGDWWTLEASNRQFLNEVSVEEPERIDEESIQTVVGRLFLIEVDPGTEQIGVIVNNRQIECHYPEALAETIRQLVPSSLVEVTGLVTLDSGGNLQRISEIVDVKEIEVRPIMMRRVIADNRRYNLRSPISVQVEFRRGLWIHEFEPLGILAYATTRQESLNDFRRDFAFLWKELAQADDSELTSDAIEVKELFHELVVSDEAEE